MYKRFIHRIKELKALKQIIIGLSVLGLYFIFITLISELVDQDIIEKDLKNWFESELNNSTYINIDHTDTALRSNWRTDLYIHELEIASPNPKFILPVLSIDTVRASSSFYSLFGGVKAKPVIQIRDGILNIKRDVSGNYNLSNIEIQTKKSLPDFLPYINIADINFVLMNCKLNLSTQNSSAILQINGNLIVNDDHMTLKGTCPKAKFSKLIDGIKKTYTSDINIHEFSINKKSKEISKLNITLEDMPITALKLLYPELPELPSGLKFSGRIKTKGESLLILGQLDNINIPKLPRYLDIKATVNRDILNQTKFFSIEVSSYGENIFTLKSNKSNSSKWEPLKAFISSFNVNNLFSSSESYWIKYLVSKFSAISLVASSASISNFDIGEAVINIVKTSEGKANISLDGIIAEGKLTLLAKNISLTNTDLPETVMATLEIKDASNTLVRFSKNLPEILDCTPTSGNGELAILYKRGDNNNKIPLTKVQLKLNDVTIPTLSSGSAITSLALLPQKLNKLNKLCFDPLNTSNNNNVKLIKKLSDITLKSLTVSYETSDNNIKFSTIEAQSKEIGDIQGTLSNVDEGKLKLNLDIYNLPTETLKLAQLSKISLNAYFKFIKENPLRIELIEGTDIINHDKLFIEEIYRYWLLNQILTKNDTGEKE